MKIYEEIVLNWNGDVISSKSFEYKGNISLCGGGGKGGYVPPPAPAPQKAQTKPVDESQTVARENQREKALKAQGIKSSILTQQQGAMAENQQAGKTLLGQ